MRKFCDIEKILPLITHMTLPAILFACTLLGFCLTSPFETATSQSMHVLFYITSFACTIILLYFNLNKSLFMLLSITVAYILINLLKHTHGTDFTNTAAYQNICVFLPANLLFFYYWPNNRFLSVTTVYLLLGFFCEYALIEHLSRADISLGLCLNMIGTPYFNPVAVVLFTSCLLCIFINAIRLGDIWNYNTFFAVMFVAFGLIYASSSSGLSIFFLGASVCIILAVAQTIYMETHRDPLTGLYSRNSFMMHAKKLKFKYSLGIISIDDYDKLAQNFGKHTQNTLIKLICDRMSDLEKEDNIYRYSPDEFIILYPDLDKKETFARIEEIRRAIASALFEYSPRKKPLKLTISAVVVEKKRQDLTPFEVLVRAHKTLQKNRNFSHNITSFA